MPPSTDTHRAAARPVEPTAPAALGDRGLGLLLAIGGLIGLIAATTLLVEKIALIEDPNYVPSCSINPILSCGSVMVTPQAAVFGIPNPIIGVAGFAGIAAIGFAVLAGLRLRGWFALLVQAGVTFGVLFIHWLIFQSLYRITALCPYCMVVWVVTIPIFWRTTVHNLQALRRPGGGALTRAVDVVTRYRALILVAWYLVILGMIGNRFWDYWITLIV